MSWTLSEINRRLSNIARMGTISELSDETARVRVRIGQLHTDWLPWFTHRAGSDRSWWAPEPGEQVMVISPGGDLSQGVVLPAIYQNDHPSPKIERTVHHVEYADNSTVEYDREAHQFQMDLGPVRITINRERILAECNGSTFEMDENGIRLNGNRIDLN